MSDLLAELTPDFEAVADPLFEMSRTFVRKRGEFLPHVAMLEADGRVRMGMGVPSGDPDKPTSALEVLPLLHDALRAEAREHDLRAVAVCEDVTITLAGQKPTKAVKVLVEHRRGLVVALYLPWRRKLIGGYVFGELIVMTAQPEVRPWGDEGSA